MLSLLLLLPLVGLTTPVSAQAEENPIAAPFEEYGWETKYNWRTLKEGYDYSNLTEAGVGAGIIATIFGGVMFFSTIMFSIGMYVFEALALMDLAQKMGEQKKWFAWVPILQIALLLKLGDQNPWLVLIALIPGIGSLIVTILSLIATMKICEKRGYDKLLGLLLIIPIANLVLLGLLAWGKKT